MRGNPGNVNIIPLSSCLFILIVHPKINIKKHFIAQALGDGDALKMRLDEALKDKGLKESLAV